MPEASLSELASNVAIVLIFLGFMWKVGSKFLASLDKNTKSNEKTAKAMASLVAEIRKGNIEAAERNGHLGEQNIHIAQLVNTHTKMVKEEFAKLDKQTIKEQKVEHQVVKEVLN